MVTDSEFVSGTEMGTCGLYHPYSDFLENRCIGVFDHADYESELGFSISYHLITVLSFYHQNHGGGIIGFQVRIRKINFT